MNLAIGLLSMFALGILAISPADRALGSAARLSVHPPFDGVPPAAADLVPVHSLLERDAVSS